MSLKVRRRFSRWDLDGALTRIQKVKINSSQSLGRRPRKKRAAAQN
jgi:hypothetical protein